MTRPALGPTPPPLARALRAPSPEVLWLSNKLTTHLCQVPRSRLIVVIPLLLLYVFMACAGTTLRLRASP